MAELTISEYNKTVLNQLKQTSGLEAIASVLLQPERYFSGRVKLSDREISQIRAKGSELKQKINHKSESEYRKELQERLEADNSPKEDSLETVFHRGGGRAWEIGEEIRFQGQTFVVSHVIRNALGLKMAIFVPKDPASGEKPIISCNGTSSIQNAIDDLSKSIGLRSVLGSNDEIGKALDEVVSKYGPVRIGGHSLGGAIAQDITALYCDKLHEGKSYITECHYFNSPGPGKMIYKLFNNKKSQLIEMGIKPPIVRSYRNEDDIIPRFGGPHLPADHYVIVSDPRFKFSFNMIMQAHKVLGFFTNKQLNIKSVAEDRPASPLLEYLRRKIGAIVKPILIKLYGNRDLHNRINLLKDYFQRNQAVPYHRA